VNTAVAAADQTSLCISSQANPLVYFDIALGRYGDAVPLGRIVMELKEDVVPRTTGGGGGGRQVLSLREEGWWWCQQQSRVFRPATAAPAAPAAAPVGGRGAEDHRRACVCVGGGAQEVDGCHVL
jgi:hypothetical protein